MTVAVYGARGFVGSAIVAALGRRGVDYIPVTRSQMIYEKVDVAINAACPSRRLQAERDPMWDYYETVGKTADLYYNTTWRRFLQVSSLSARYPENSVYGRHRLAAEKLIRGLVVRLGPMYGEGLTKGVLVDMLADRPVYADPYTRYSFAPVSWVGERIVDLALGSAEGVIDVGGSGSLSLNLVARLADSKSEFLPSDFLPHREDQIIPGDDGPDSTLVVGWLRKRLSQSDVRNPDQSPDHQGVEQPVQ